MKMEMKKVVLQGIARTAEKAVEEASGSKSMFIFFEPEMPEKLRQEKFAKKSK